MTNEESIKSSERARRGNVQMQEIRNPTRVTPLPKQRLKMLSNPKNKANIANFLLTDWIKKCEKELPERREIYLSGGFHDMKREVKVVLGSQSEIDEFKSDHKEADSRMFLHIAHTKQVLGVDRVLLWSIDSDVGAMCPRFCLLLDIKEFYFKTGVGKAKR